MTKSGKIRIIVSAVSILLFIFIIIPFILQPNSKRWKVNVIEKNWNISIPKEIDVLYYNQSGFSFFGDGNYYTVAKIESNLDLEDFKLVDDDLQFEIESWYKYSHLDISQEYMFSFTDNLYGQVQKKKDDKCILLYDLELKLLFVLQTFQ